VQTETITLSSQPPSPAYTFDSFIVSDPTRHAFSAAIAVAEKPDGATNPLVLHGKSGTGKTHLLHAIHNALRARQASVVRLPAAELIEQLLNALRRDELPAFESALFTTNILLLDDIRLHPGIPRTEEEFYRTLERCLAHGMQLVVTSDVLPDTTRPFFAHALIVQVG
jgi:chromosomal replication initiator protein